MHEQPAVEHQWLQKLVGDWISESECITGPDMPPIHSTGREVVRSLGGLWTISEGTMGEGGDSGQSVMTLGFDPIRKKFIGTFIASMMTHLWPYEGELDSDGRRLVLDSQGPSFATPGSYAKYQDTIEFHDENLRTLSSRMLMPHGQWVHFMKATYRRIL